MDFAIIARISPSQMEKPISAFRNAYAHRLIDPNPDDAGKIIVFVDYLLKVIGKLLNGQED